LLIEASARGDVAIESEGEIEFGPGSITLHVSGLWHRLSPPAEIWLDRPDGLPRLEALAPGSTGHFSLNPRETALVYSRERIGLGQSCFGLISGTSDLARVGVSVEFSWFVAPGFGLSRPSALVLEIFNANDAIVHFPNGMRIGHLLIGEYGRETDLGYESAPLSYNSNTDPTPNSRIAERHAKSRVLLGPDVL
jgi:deoxycytidine triphosphate deaminase